MKKAILAAALFTVMGAAHAKMVTPDADFQWKGTIPGTIETLENFFVVSPDGSELTNIGNGALNFTHIDGKVELDQSTSYDFRVVQGGEAGEAYNPSADPGTYTNVDFQLDLISLESGREGFLEGQDEMNGYFAIEANDTRLFDQSSAQKNSAFYNAGELANLTVVKNPAQVAADRALNDINPEAESHVNWHVHARIAISAPSII